MTEQEYMDLSDLQLLRAAKVILVNVNAFDDPNKSRLASIMANIYLMEERLEPAIILLEEEK